jgi:hypothetical protein
MSDPITRYLLDDLSEEEREGLEEQYLASDEVWDAVTAAENDLIDAYLRGGLSPRERGQFEAAFLTSPRRRERVEFARSLMSVPRPMPGGGRRRSLPARGWAIAAAACVSLAIMAGSLVVRTVPREPPSRRDDVQRPAGVDIAAVSVLLTPGLARGADGRRVPIVSISSAPSSIRLVLDMRRDDFRTYEVAVHSAEGTTVHRVGGLESQPTPNGGRAVIVDLPSRVLAAADYVVDLSGQTASGPGGQLVDSYNFSATR